VPRWNISISEHIREAGANAVQEVAFTLANAIAYVQAAIDSGLQVDEFAAQLSFFFAAHNHFLEEVAKFRAARRLWAQIMRERFNAQDPSPGCFASTPKPGDPRSPPNNREQHRPGHHPGSGRCSGWHTISAHELNG